MANTPNPGDRNWGDQLNNYLAAQEAAKQDRSTLEGDIAARIGAGGVLDDVLTAQYVPAVLAQLSESNSAAQNKAAFDAAVATAAPLGLGVRLPMGEFDCNPVTVHAWDGMAIFGAGAGHDASARATTRLVNPNTSGQAALAIDVGTDAKRWGVHLFDFELVGNASSGDGLVVGETAGTRILGPVIVERVACSYHGGWGKKFIGKIDQLNIRATIDRYNANGVLLDASGGTNGFISETKIDSMHSSFNTGCGFRAVGDTGNITMEASETSTQQDGIDYQSGGRSMVVIGHHMEGISQYPFRLRHGSAYFHVSGGSFQDSAPGSGLSQVFFLGGGINMTRVLIEGFTAYVKRNPTVLVNLSGSTGSKHRQRNNKMVALTGTPTMYAWRAIDNTACAGPNAGVTSTRPPDAALEVGDVFYDTTVGYQIVWNGSSWQGAAGATGATGPAGPGSFGIPRSIDPGVIDTGNPGAIGVANRVRWFRVKDSGSISKVTVNIVAGAAGNMRVAVYRNTGSGRSARPDGAPLGESASVSTNTTGNVDITLGSSVVVADGDWLAIHVDNNTATFARKVGLSIPGFSYQYDAAGFPAFPTISAGVPFVTESGQVLGMFGG